MLKKIILIIISLFLIACSSIEEIPKKDLVSSKNETIKLAITTPEREVILLGENYDYQFTGEEARKLLTLIDFFKMKGLTKENVSRIDKKITVNENGEVRLWVSTDFIISKKNNEDKVRANLSVDIVLTGNPSEEEIMSIILPEGREVSFDGVKINAENSVDGKEHDIHSFDEWREYCKLAKDPGKYASPVVK